MLSQPAPQIIFRRHETFVIANLFKIFQVFPMFPGKRFENLRCLKDSQSLSNSHPRSQQVPAGPIIPGRPSSRIWLLDKSTVCRCLPWTAVLSTEAFTSGSQEVQFVTFKFQFISTCFNSFQFIR